MKKDVALCKWIMSICTCASFSKSLPSPDCCTFAFVAEHELGFGVIGKACSELTSLHNYSVHSRYPKELFQDNFIRKAVSKLEQLSFVERYAWFALEGDTGLYANGALTSAGYAYWYAHR